MSSSYVTNAKKFFWAFKKPKPAYIKSSVKQYFDWTEEKVIM